MKTSIIYMSLASVLKSSDLPGPTLKKPGSAPSPPPSPPQGPVVSKPKVLYSKAEPSIKISVPFVLLGVGAKFVAAQWVTVTELGNGGYNVLVQGWGYIRAHGHKLWEDKNWTIFNGTLTGGALSMRMPSNFVAGKFGPAKMETEVTLSLTSKKVSLSMHLVINKIDLKVADVSFGWK